MVEIPFAASIAVPNSLLAIGVEIELFHACRKLFRRWLAIQSCGIERAMTEQGGQANQVAGELREIPAGKRVPQRMRARLFWHEMASCFHQVRDHLSYRRGTERASFLTLEDRKEGFWRLRFGPLRGDCFDRWFLDAKSRTYQRGKRITGRAIQRYRTDLIPFARLVHGRANPWVVE